MLDSFMGIMQLGALIVFVTGGITYFCYEFKNGALRALLGGGAVCGIGVLFTLILPAFLTIVGMIIAAIVVIVIIFLIWLFR